MYIITQENKLLYYSKIIMTVIINFILNIISTIGKFNNFVIPKFGMLNDAESLALLMQISIILSFKLS